MSWPVPWRPLLKTTFPSDLSLAELCIFLLAAKAALISEAARVICTLELYWQLHHHHPRPYSFLWGGCWLPAYIRDVGGKGWPCLWVLG